MDTVPQKKTNKKKRRREEPDAAEHPCQAQPDDGLTGEHEAVLGAELASPAAERPAASWPAPGGSAPGAAAGPQVQGEGHAQAGRATSDDAGGAAEARARAGGSAGGGGAPAAKEGKKKAAPVLPWMRLPISVGPGEGTPLAQVRGLDARLRASLQAGGIAELFPVQAAAWAHTAGGASAAHDLCISAPTGSGKTLAYALPIVQGLSGRCVPRLRCLVVLPTRDLAAQVFKVFAALCPTVGIRVGLAAAQASVGAEATALFAGAADAHPPEAGTGGAPCVDILVATPGRLMAHMKGTPGATLEHLRYLVIDEMDRLMRQAYQDWLPFVTAAASRPPARSSSGGAASAAPALGSRVLKFVASATLTRDPSKIERLGLHCPRCIALGSADHRYALPRALREYKVVCAGADKPLVAAALLAQLGAERTVVFTASVEATRRLFVLLSAIPALASRVAELSSANSAAQRAAALAAFRAGGTPGPDGQATTTTILVASDAMTRGMDVERVANVVSYDAPAFAKTYVHRAGRTARAGRAGRVFTLLRVEEVRHFKGLLRKVDNAYVRDYALDKGALEALRPGVAHALGVLQAYLSAHAAGA